MRKIFYTLNISTKAIYPVDSVMEENKREKSFIFVPDCTGILGILCTISFSRRKI